MAKKTLDKCRKGKDFIGYAARQGAEIKNGKGSHAKVYTDKGMCPVPRHCKDLPTGTRRAIMRQFMAIGIMLLLLGCTLSQLVATGLAAALQGSP